MSELREFLKDHNLSITRLAKLIGVRRETVVRYDNDPERCTAGTRVKIETALKMILEEGWTRPVLDKHWVIDPHEDFGLREKHLREVVRFEKAFKEAYRARMESCS